MFGGQTVHKTPKDRKTNRKRDKHKNEYTDKETSREKIKQS